MEEDRLGVGWINANSKLGRSGKILIINRIGYPRSRTCGGEYKRFPLQVINHYPKRSENSRTTSRDWQTHSQSIEQELCISCYNWQVTAHHTAQLMQIARELNALIILQKTLGSTPNLYTKNWQIPAPL